jgi:cbb3-type cytochrome oxidase maturation protein
VDQVLILLIPLSVVLIFVIGALFWWSVRSGQFDDLEGPAHRIIADDDRPLDPGQHAPSPRTIPSAITKITYSGRRRNRKPEEQST